MSLLSNWRFIGDFPQPAAVDSLGGFEVHILPVQSTVVRGTLQSGLVLRRGLVVVEDVC